MRGEGGGGEYRLFSCYEPNRCSFYKNICTTSFGRFLVCLKKAPELRSLGKRYFVHSTRDKTTGMASKDASHNLFFTVFDFFYRQKKHTHTKKITDKAWFVLAQAKGSFTHGQTQLKCFYPCVVFERVLYGLLRYFYPRKTLALIERF